MTESVRKMVSDAAKLLNSTLEAIANLHNEMDSIASQLPEYETVMSLYGAGKVFCSQLIAEIGDVTKLKSSKSLVALAGIDPPPNQSGKEDKKSRSIWDFFLRFSLTFAILPMESQIFPGEVTAL